MHTNQVRGNHFLKETEQIFKPGHFVRTDTCLEVNTPYYYGYDVTDRYVDVMRSYEHDKLFIISCASVTDLYGEELGNGLRQNNVPFETVVIPDGELNKNINKLSYLCEELVSRNVSKDSILVAFGGGTIGNITGLAAALIFRGIRFIEMPTTTMGITDSTLSNKQAVNGRSGKNHFGVYHAPIFIWADTKFALSEPLVNTKGTLVEGIKNGLIFDHEILDYFKPVLNPECRFSRETYHEMLYRIINSKRKILKIDPSEKKFGLVLEYGHTFGHSIEWLTKGTITHGEAVAIGMCIAGELSHALGHCRREEVDLHYHLLRGKLGLDISIPTDITTDNILKTIMVDNKKNAAGTKFVLLTGVGRVHDGDGEYTVQVDNETLRSVIEYYRQRNPDKRREEYPVSEVNTPAQSNLIMLSPQVVRQLTYRYDGPLRSALREGSELATKAAVQKEWKVLDVGAGTGYLSLALAEAVGPEGVVYCLDHSTQLLEVLHQKATTKGLERIIKPVAHDCTQSFPFSDGYFDAVFSSYLLHELEDKASLIMSEAYRVLRPNGKLVIADYRKIDDEERLREIESWYKMQDGDGKEERRLRFSLHDLKRMYLDANFRNIALSTWFDFHMHGIGMK